MKKIDIEKLHDVLDAEKAPGNRGCPVEVRIPDLHRFPGGPEAGYLPDWCHPAFAVIDAGEPCVVSYGRFVEAKVMRAHGRAGTSLYNVETRLITKHGAWTDWLPSGEFSGAGVRDLLERLVVATVGGRHV